MTPASPQDEASGPPPLEPLHVDVARLVRVGTAIWAVALALTLLVPGLHSGSRDWWPWSALSGVLMGFAALTYLHRGRGNAAAQ